MSEERSSIPRPLATMLDELSAERGGKVACIVLFHSDEVEIIYPSKMTRDAICLVEDALLFALASSRDLDV